MTIYIDNFNREDNTILGSPWLESEYPNSSLIVTSNQLYMGCALYNKPSVAYYNESAIENDQFSEIIWSQLLAGWASMTGPMVRISPIYWEYGNLTGYAFTRFGVFFELRKFVNTNLHISRGEILETYEYSPIYGDSIRLHIVDSTIRVLINNTVIITYIDESSPLLTGKPGLVSGGGPLHVGIELINTWIGGDASYIPIWVNESLSKIVVNDQNKTIDNKYILVNGVWKTISASSIQQTNFT